MLPLYVDIKKLNPRPQAPPHHCPINLQKVRQAFKTPHWKVAIDREYGTLIKNKMGKLVPLAPHQNLVSCKLYF